MNDRVLVNLRLDRDVLEELDRAAADAGLDRSELVRRLLVDGLRRSRVERALEAYREGRASAEAAAESAGVSLYEMLDRISEAGVPYRLDEEVFEALDRLAEPGPDDVASGIDALRSKYRPATVSLLLVGESSPAGGTHFYRADSNLFRAVHAAYAEALGETTVPDGEAFLRFFSDRGGWLVDLVDRPVNRIPGRPRKDHVDAGIEGLRGTLVKTRPQRIVVIKSSVAGAVRQAARLAGFDDARIDVLPFPLYQWRRTFIDQLAAILRADASAEPARQRRTAEVVARYGSDTLHEAMAAVLEARANRWASARAIADEIARLDLFRRPSDGEAPPPAQISARARKYPDLFQISDQGIRLRRTTS